MALKKFVRNDNNLAITYCRFSSENQSDISITQQQEKAYELAKKNGLKIVENYVDEAKTGKTTVGRDDFNRMLNDIAILKPAYLIVWKNDRLGRDRKELMLSKEQVRKCGVDIIATSEAYIPCTKGKKECQTLS